MSLSKFINCEYFDVPFDAVRCKNLEVSFLVSECVCTLFLALMIRKTWRKYQMSMQRKQNYYNTISMLILLLIVIGLVLSIFHNILNIGFFSTSESDNQQFLHDFLLMLRIDTLVICIILQILEQLIMIFIIRIQKNLNIDQQIPEPIEN